MFRFVLGIWIAQCRNKDNPSFDRGRNTESR